MPLARYGLEWLHADLPMAHPFLDGTAAVLSRSVAETAASFGPRDAGTYRRLVEPFLSRWDTLAHDFMSLPLTSLPRDPVTLARFGLAGLPPSTWLMRRFRDERAKALFAGLVGHVMAPLDGVATGAVGLVFALAAHARGWPVARGGSQAISDALTAYLTDLGGTVHTGLRGQAARRPATRPRVRLRHLTHRPGPYRGLRRLLRALSVRRGRLQDRLRAGRPRALDGARRPARRPPSRSARTAPRSTPPCAPPPARAGPPTPPS